MTIDWIKRLAVVAGAALLMAACDRGTVGPLDGGSDDGSMPCEDPTAIDACLELQLCCRLILVNPVFFESCNQVVLECDPVECRRVLDGYIQCRLPEPDGGVDGGGVDGGGVDGGGVDGGGVGDGGVGDGGANDGG